MAKWANIPTRQIFGIKKAMVLTTACCIGPGGKEGGLSFNVGEQAGSF